jgi:hypothetical protein
MNPRPLKLRKLSTPKVLLRSNRRIFTPYNTGSPSESMTTHISGLGPLARLDFERCLTAEEVLYTVEGDWMPTSQEDEESRIATLAHAIKKLGNPEDAAEFIRCLNQICEGYNARCRQLAASHYYSEIDERGAGPVLKDMALMGMQLASLHPITDEEESDCDIFYMPGELNRREVKPRSFFDQEVADIERMIRGRRKCARLVHDEWAELFNDLEDLEEPLTLAENESAIEEFYEKLKQMEAMDQYDEGGAIVQMSKHERVYARGRVDNEFTTDDLPFELNRDDPDELPNNVNLKKQCRHLARTFISAYLSGVESERVWEKMNEEINGLFPVKIQTLEGKEAFSRANIRLQRITREMFDGLLEECFSNNLLITLRDNRSYRQLYRHIRRTTDTIRKQAYKARDEEPTIKLRKQSRYFAGDLLRSYASGVDIEEIWENINGELEFLFPVIGPTLGGGEFFSRANIDLQRFTREVLEEMLENCFGDYHLNAMRNNPLYRQFYGKIRRASDTSAVGTVMKQAYKARKDNLINVKHLTALKTAANNQRERLLSAPLSATAYRLIKEILTASESKLSYLGRAMYGENELSHPIHSLSSQERQRVWEFHTACKGTILLPRVYAKLCSTWGRVMPRKSFTILVGFNELLELPRLRNALKIVLNKQKPSILMTKRPVKKPILAQPPAAPIRGAIAMTKGAASTLQASASRSAL